MNITSSTHRTILLAVAAVLISTYATAKPQLAVPQTQYSGAQLYMLNCSNCHGTYGEGDGAVTPDLSVALLDLRYLSDRNAGVFPTEFVREIVDGRTTRSAHGPQGMPIWGAEFARGEGLDDAAADRVNAKIDALVDYLESTQIIDD